MNKEYVIIEKHYDREEAINLAQKMTEEDSDFNYRLPEKEDLSEIYELNHGFAYFYDRHMESYDLPVIWMNQFEGYRSNQYYILSEKDMPDVNTDRCEFNIVLVKEEITEHENLSISNLYITYTDIYEYKKIDIDKIIIENDRIIFSENFFLIRSKIEAYILKEMDDVSNKRDKQIIKIVLPLCSNKVIEICYEDADRTLIYKKNKTDIIIEKINSLFQKLTKKEVL